MRASISKIVSESGEENHGVLLGAGSGTPGFSIGFIEPQTENIFHFNLKELFG